MNPIADKTRNQDRQQWEGGGAGAALAEGGRLGNKAALVNVLRGVPWVSCLEQLGLLISYALFSNCMVIND